ncbi:MAG: peptide chain release factor 1 [Methylophilaceae bacterium]|nr:peptide chain release factor 1 [Methylophilaceae bacterium]
MKPSILQKLANLSERLDELNRLMSSEDITNDMDNYLKITREHAEITPIVEQYITYVQTEADMKEAEGMLNDPEMKEFAQEEISAGKKQLEAIETELQKLLVPKDPNDDKNIIMEIRAGTGGDESALFAGDLFRMYSRYVEKKRWKLEVLSSNESDVGGYKEIIAKIEGQGAYSKLKFESGGHRVQRVPDTETQGRIHTSACTVAILPEVEDVADVTINPADIRLDTFRASGAGGQHINKTDSAVRITHAPTGIVVECQDGRSQHQNKAQAMQVLAARVKAKEVDAQNAEIASERRNLIGSGDRSQRIRTYNYPQGRITDHRINLTLYKIDAITEGDLDELIAPLAAEHQADMLAMLGEDN